MTDDCIAVKVEDVVSSTEYCPEIAAADLQVKNEVTLEDETKTNCTGSVPNELLLNCEREMLETSETDRRSATTDESITIKIENSVCPTDHFVSNVKPFDVKVKEELIPDDEETNDTENEISSEVGSPVKNTLSTYSDFMDTDVVIKKEEDLGIYVEEEKEGCTQPELNSDVPSKNEESEAFVKLSKKTDKFDASNFNLPHFQPIVLLQDIKCSLQFGSVNNEKLCVRKAPSWLHPPERKMGIRGRRLYDREQRKRVAKLKVTGMEVNYEAECSDPLLVVTDVKPVDTGKTNPLLNVSEEEEGSTQLELNFDVSIKNKELEADKISDETDKFDKSKSSVSNFQPIVTEQTIRGSLQVKNKKLSVEKAPARRRHRKRKAGLPRKAQIKKEWRRKRKLAALKAAGIEVNPLQEQSRPIFSREEELFPCVLCKLKFKSEVELNSHLLSHSKKIKASPALGRSQFESESGLMKHMPAHSDESLYLCLFCPAKFTGQWMLNRHLIIHAELKPFRCTHCTAKFADLNTLKAHLVTHLKDKRLSCIYCSSLFNSQSMFERHLANHSGEKVFSCRKCPRILKTKSEAEEHRLFHFDPKKPNGCFFCSEKFILKIGLARHLAGVHAWVRPFACRHCGGKFKTKAERWKHLFLHEDLEGLSCPWCPSMFQSQSYLNKHLVTHSADKLSHSTKNSESHSVKESLLTNLIEEPLSDPSEHLASLSVEESLQTNLIEEPLSDPSEHLASLSVEESSHEDQSVSCPYCSSNFRLQSELNDHLMTHLDEMKLFQCPYCPKKWAVKAKLRAHLNTHVREKPFSCFHCSIKVKDKQTLTAHLERVHSNARRFACLHCSETFKTKSTLEEHLVAHSFGCSLCSRKFKLKVDLKHHIAEAHDGKLYCCSVCPAKFKGSNDLKHHSLVHLDSEKPVSCLYSDAEFKQAEILKNHSRIHSDVSPSPVHTADPNSSPSFEFFDANSIKNETVSDPPPVDIADPSSRPSFEFSFDGNSIKNETASDPPSGDIADPSSRPSFEFSFAANSIKNETVSDPPPGDIADPNSSPSFEFFNANSIKNETASDPPPGDIAVPSSRPSFEFSFAANSIKNETVSDPPPGDIANPNSSPSFEFFNANSIKNETVSDPPAVDIADPSSRPGFEFSFDANSIKNETVSDPPPIDIADPSSRPSFEFSFDANSIKNETVSQDSSPFYRPNPNSSPSFGTPFDANSVDNETGSQHPSPINIAETHDVMPYSCLVCPAKFKQNCQLKRHSLIHSDERPFSCSYCNSKFKEHRSLRKHLSKFHSDGRLSPVHTADPNSSLSYKRSFDTNSINNETANPNLSPSLGMSFDANSIKNETVSHPSSVHFVDPSSWPCYGTPFDASSIKNETVSHYPSLFYVDNPNSSPSFGTSLDANSEDNERASQHPSPINITEMHNVRPFTILRHLSTAHSDKRPSPVHFANPSSRPRFGAPLDTNSVHNETVSYPSLVHIAEMYDVRPHCCLVCPAKFKTTYALKCHSSVHSDERPFLCRHCDCKFKVRSSLTRHSKIHSDLRPSLVNSADSNLSPSSAVSLDANSVTNLTVSYPAPVRIANPSLMPSFLTSVATNSIENEVMSHPSPICTANSNSSPSFVKSFDANLIKNETVSYPSPVHIADLSLRP